MRRSWTPLAIGACLLLIGACSTSDDGTWVPSTTAAGSQDAVPGQDGIVAGYSTQTDEASPLVIRAVGPAPIPVTGTDDKVHLVYELEVLNYSPRAATLTELDTLVGGPDGDVVASVAGEALTERTILVVDAAPEPIAEIPVGRSALILVDDVYETKTDVPSTFSHRLTATFGALDPEYAGLGAVFPDGEVVQFGAPVATGVGSPVVIGPPLAGDGWLAANACCSLSSHRGTMLPIGGRINASERYAIDWFRADPDGEVPPGAVVPSVVGDLSENESYRAYGAPLLAVADGTVVTVVSEVADTPARIPPAGIRLHEMGGNVITIDIGGGVFAFYAHVVPGSTTVKVGDTVTRGQVIGTLGNSGNSTEPHLHFHLSSSAAALTGDNIAFEIDTLTLVGNYDGPTFVPGPNPGPRTNQLPLIASLIAFPEVP